VRRILPLLGLLLLAGLAGSGCVMSRVQPWERDLLAEPEMLPVPDPLEAGIDDHIYFSKETAHGGASVGGGGCGCN
jgi:hypothetical protein